MTPVPPFPTASVPVTPGLQAAAPVNPAVDVLARLVRKFLDVANAVAVPALPDIVPLISFVTLRSVALKESNHPPANLREDEPKLITLSVNLHHGLI